jgi:hypothetical protein
MKYLIILTMLFTLYSCDKACGNSERPIVDNTKENLIIDVPFNVRMKFFSVKGKEFAVYTCGNINCTGVIQIR